MLLGCKTLKNLKNPHVTWIFALPTFLCTRPFEIQIVFLSARTLQSYLRFPRPPQVILSAQRVFSCRARGCPGDSSSHESIGSRAGQAGWHKDCPSVRRHPFARRTSRFAPARIEKLVSPLRLIALFEGRSRNGFDVVPSMDGRCSWRLLLHSRGVSCEPNGY